MATKSKTVKKLTPSQLDYMAGIFDGAMNLRTPGNNSAVLIFKNKGQMDFLASTYGGEIREFTSQSAKVWQGWYLTSEQKLALFQQLEAMDKVKSLTPYECDGIRAKLERGTSSERAARGGEAT